MKLGIIGSRTFKDMELLTKSLVPFLPKVTLVVSGGAEGADKMGELWAKRNDIPTLVFLPDWDNLGSTAGFARNEDIINNSDIVVAFWDYTSNGTRHSINLCNQLKKPCKIVKI